MLSITLMSSCCKTFPLRIYSVNVTKSTVSCGLVTFTEEIFNRKLHFLCSDTAHFWQELSLSIQEIKNGSFKFQGMMFEIL